MTEALVSLVIEPHHLSVEQDWERVLTSIERQDHKHLEVLCHCPSDLVDSLSRFHETLRLIQFLDYEFTNRGQFWNSIAERSTGDFIGITDPRYVLCTNSISARLTSLLSDHSYGLVSSSIMQMDSEGAPFDIFSEPDDTQVSNSDVYGGEEDRYPIARTIGYIDTHSVLINKDVLGQGLRSSGYEIKHDTELWLLLLEYTNYRHLHNQTSEIWVDPRISIEHYLNHHQDRIKDSVARYRFIDIRFPESQLKSELWLETKHLLEQYAVMCYDSQKPEAWLMLVQALHEIDTQQAQRLIADLTWSLIQDLDENQIRGILLGMDESRMRNELKQVRFSRLWRIAQFVRKLLR